MMGKPLLLDLFCGAGGAGEGYSRAGFRVIGCDLNPKPLKYNPHEHYVGDALAVLDTLIAGEIWQGYHLADFTAIHASPPCQAYSLAARNERARGKAYPKLIEATRDKLNTTRLPWVMENVPGAPLHSPMMLCGSMFGLGVQRHRLFESPVLALTVVFAPATCRHDYIPIAVCGNGTPSWYKLRVGVNAHKADWEVAMGIDWMSKAALAQAIPPAYTQWIGSQLMSAITAKSAAA